MKYKIWFYLLACIIPLTRFHIWWWFWFIFAVLFCVLKRQCKCSKGNDDHAFYSFQNKIIPFSNAVERSLQRYHISAEDVVYDTTLSSSINIAGRFTYRRSQLPLSWVWLRPMTLFALSPWGLFEATLSLTCYKELGHKINK